jgi:hypothetical protein
MVKIITAYFRNLKFTPIFTKVCHLTPPWLSLIQYTNSRHISLQSILITLNHETHKFSKYSHQNLLHVSTSHRAEYSANLILLVMFILIIFRHKSVVTHYAVFFRLCQFPPLFSNITDSTFISNTFIWYSSSHILTKYAKYRFYI